MNAAFEMSIWLMISITFLVQLQSSSTNSFSTAYRHSESGRKLFGGYRIVPRLCTATSEEKRSQSKTGICMFNYECNQKGGEMIGSCIDGFLFGVCCSLSSSSEFESDHFASYFNTISSSPPPPPGQEMSSVSFIPPPSPSPSLFLNKRPTLSSSNIKGDGLPSTKLPSNRRPILEHYFGNQTHGGFINNEGFLPLHKYPVADTVLLNLDGTLVEDDHIPEKIFTPQLSNHHPSFPIHNFQSTPSFGHHSPTSSTFGHHSPTTPSITHHSPTSPTFSHHSPAQATLGYVVENEYFSSVNKKKPPKIGSVTPGVTHGIDITVNNIHQIANKLTAEHMSKRPTPAQGIYNHVSTQRPVHSPSPQAAGNTPHVTFVRYPTPGLYTTPSAVHKKTDMLPLPSTTPKPKPSYVLNNDNMILLPTFTNQKIKYPPTRGPTESPQVTRKSSDKPLHMASTAVKTTTASYDLDDNYSSYNYNFYTGSSKPPILINHPAGIEDSGQAISHILGILNTTEPKPETVTQMAPSDGGLSTWVSIVGDEKPHGSKHPSKPGLNKPSSTATTYVHGPSYTVTAGDNRPKPAPTVVVISQDHAGNSPIQPKPTKPTKLTKPTKRPVSGVVSHTTNKLVIKNPTKPTFKPETVKPTKPPETPKPTKQTFPPTTSKPTKTTAEPVTPKPTKPMNDPEPPKPTKFTQIEETEIFHTSQENLINFPPVRNPEIINPGGLNQMEKPTVVQTYLPSEQDEDVHLPNGLTLDVLPENVDLNSIDADDDDYDDITTPSLQEEKVGNQVHLFVEKIVNSLSGNFQDLEHILFKNENKSSITNANGIQLNNVYVGEDVDEYATEDYSTVYTPTRKPVRRPTTYSPEDYDTTILETSITPPQKRPKPTTKRPLTTYETTISGIIIKKPTGSTVTKRPSTGIATPTRRPPPSIITASKKPTTFATTRKPTPSIISAAATATTKRPGTKPRPKPTVTTKRTTTTEVTESVLDDEVSEEITAEVIETSTSHSLDYRRECGIRPLVKKTGKIVGGKGSQFGSYPWQVLVRESTWLGLFTKNKCGGVLITNRYVITAAHCQPGFLASLVAVFGEYDISGELEARRSVAKNVRRVIVHRQYDPATFENDLALLELDSPVAYDEHIVPICMPKEGEDYVGRMATVTGWGRLKYGGGVPSVLQEVRVPLIENSVCQEMFQTAGHQKRIISSFLCAGYANGQKDSCEGDSGGPLMVEREDGRWVLLGTVSHGIKCAAPYLPGVYMRTTYYKPWLKSITGVST